MNKYPSFSLSKDSWEAYKIREIKRDLGEFS